VAEAVVIRIEPKGAESVCVFVLWYSIVFVVIKVDCDERRRRRSLLRSFTADSSLAWSLQHCFRDEASQLDPTLGAHSPGSSNNVSAVIYPTSSRRICE
jgi:hypothetical protein